LIVARRFGPAPIDFGGLLLDKTSVKNGKRLAAKARDR
jgi:hypothetical protein